MKRYLLSTLALSLITAFAAAADNAPLTSGIDVKNIDPSVRVQDDFYTHLNGQWLKTTEIPADKPSWGTFAKLRDDTLSELRGIIEKTEAQKGKKAGSDAQKIGDLYASFMDEKKLDAAGIRPLTGELNRIRAIKDKKAFPMLIAHLDKLGVTTPYAVNVRQDARESTKYAVGISQSGLGLPDRDYYLKKDDAKLAAILVKYEAHIARTLKLAGEKDPEANAKAIVALETALAEAQWTKVQNRDPVKRYNKTPIARLPELAPDYDWGHALAAAGVASKVDYVIVSQPSYLAGFNAVLEKTDLATWKAYFAWQLVRSASPYLSKEFADASFDFYGTALTGVAVQEPRWKRGVALVERSIGEGLGRLYVAEYFPPERKARMDELVKNLLAAYKTSIDALDWMGPETKKEAQAKLAKFTPKIGYPGKWRDYSSLAIVKSDLILSLIHI